MFGQALRLPERLEKWLIVANLKFINKAIVSGLLHDCLCEYLAVPCYWLKD